MIRLYRVKYRNEWGEVYTLRAGVPSDEADSFFNAIQLGQPHLWIKLWIEDMAGVVIDSVERTPVFRV